MKTVFFGSSGFVIPIIEVLQKNFDLKLVLTTEKKPTDAVQSYCIKNKIPYLSVQQFNNLTIQRLKKTKALIAVLADFGLMIPQEILNVFPKGIINIHPSLLPKYRGPTPVQTVILEGEKITGASIIKLDDKIDHGPILDKTQEKILATDTADSLYARLFKKGANLLPKTLDKYLKDNLILQAQNHAKATFTKPLTRQNGYIDINNPPTKEKLNLMIRAYYPWPGVWAKWKMINAKCKILKFLPDKKLQVEGKKPVSCKDFLNGYPEAKEQLKKLLE